MCAAFGDKPGENLEILIGQMVNLLRDGAPLRMSKRAGTMITLDDLVDAIGVDAARYALARYTSDTTIDIDLELWAKQTSDNPVFYVQYAHARLASILRNAADLGLAPGRPDDFDPSLLAHEKEGDLLRALAEFPRVVAAAAQLREPHRVARYLEDTASSFHKFYDACRVLPMGDEEPSDLHRARLLLVAGDQGRLRQRPEAARGLRPRADVIEVRAHEAAWAHAESGRGPSWLRQPADANALVPLLWSSTARKNDDGALEVGGVDLRRPRRRARLAGVRPRRARLPRPRPCLPRGLRRLRRLLRRQGVPVHDGRALGRRGGPLPRRLLGRRADRRAARRLRPGPDRLPRQQQDDRRAAPRRRGRGRADRRRLVHRDRAAGRGDRRARSPGRRHGAGDRRGRGAHPRVHRHRPRGPEVRLLDHARATRSRRSGGCRTRPACELLGLHSHIGSQIFDTSGFEVAARRVLTLHARVSAELGVEMPEMDLGGGFGIAYTTQDDPADPAQLATELTKIVEHECRALRGAGAAAVDRARPRHRRADGVHGLRGRHRQAGRARRRRGRAPTSRSTAG